MRTGGKVRGFFGQDCRQRVGGRRLVERPTPGQHFVDDRTETEDVGALVDGAASHLFRCHVSDGSEQHPGSRVGAGHLREPVGTTRVVAHLGETEIENLDPASAGMNTFSGLMSRCTMPFSCAAASPSAIWPAQSIA